MAGDIRGERGDALAEEAALRGAGFGGNSTGTVAPGDQVAGMGLTAQESGTRPAWSLATT